MSGPSEERDWQSTDEWSAKNVQINRLLLKHFPELAEEYERVIIPDGGEQEGPMFTYSDVFYRFLERALRTESSDSPLLERIFGFINSLAAHPDPRYAETATVGIAEFLGDMPHILRRAMPKLGSHMRKAVSELGL